MAGVMALIDQERERLDISHEKFAHQLGMSVTTYSRQKNGKQTLGLDTLKSYIRWAKQSGNTDILRAISAYVLDISPDDITITMPR